MDAGVPLHLPQQMLNEREVVRQAGRHAIRQFLESHSCFSVLRASGKLVVFDTRIPIQLAFYALVEHDMLAAPLWDPSRAQFVGLLTVSDFIDLLCHYKTTNRDVSELATESISTILGQNPNLSRPFCGADSSCSLKQASVQLLSTRQDFLPIVFVEDMRVLACLTYTNILEHLVTHFREQRRLFDDSIMDLNVGTYGVENLVMVTLGQTLKDALDLMQQHCLSALPVVEVTANGNRKLCGVYSRSDITFLIQASDAQDAVNRLDATLADMIGLNGQLQQLPSQQQQDSGMALPVAVPTTPDALRTCSPQHTLQAVFESFAQLRFDRLYVVECDDLLVGVVSAKDLVQYFLTEPGDGAPVNVAN
ncbi:hypothetical protein MPSEU_000240400 [Mayamaea pseudoterrestris]|nr:hypothetical protein MPSEU_000240400 [Mayamaea pseudoterrestris]